MRRTTLITVPLITVHGPVTTARKSTSHQKSVSQESAVGSLESSECVFLKHVTMLSACVCRHWTHRDGELHIPCGADDNPPWRMTTMLWQGVKRHVG